MSWLRRLLGCNCRCERGIAAVAMQQLSTNRKLQRMEQSLILIRALLDIREGNAKENAKALRYAIRQLGEIDSMMAQAAEVIRLQYPADKGGGK